MSRVVLNWNIFDVRKLSSLLFSVGRGDTFDETEEVTEAVTTFATTFAPTFNTVSATAPTPSNPPHEPTAAVDTDAAPCSGRPFDAFLQLKNGSIFAFRGKPGN